MAHSTIKTTILSTLAAAVVATSFSIAPVYAGGEGGGGERESSITRHKKDGSSVTLKGRNGGNTVTRTVRNRNNQVVNQQQINRNPGPSITIHNPDGTSRTITQTSRRSSISYASTTDPKTGQFRISGRLQLPFGVSIRFRN